MGIITTGISQTPPAGDEANFVATDALTSAAASTVLCCPYGWFNAAAWGTFDATVIAEKSFDGGTTWLPVYIPFTTTAVSYADAGGSTPLFEPERGVLYRWNCTERTSGTINVRFSGNGQMAMSAGF